MAASAAKYAHCLVRYPVEYRPKAPYRPEVTAPLDFAVRASEVYALDRELDRAVLSPADFAELMAEAIAGHHGPGGRLRADRVASNPYGRPSLQTGSRAGTVGMGPLRRQFLVNGFRFGEQANRFRPPWNDALVREAHTALLTGLDLTFRAGEFREEAFSSHRPDGRTCFVACPPERIQTELQSVLDWVDRYGATLMPLIPATVLLQAFYSIRPFPAGNMTTARALALLYLRFFGLPNVELILLADAVLEEPELLGRLFLWTEASGSHTELLDYTLDATHRAYEVGATRWLERSDAPNDLEEVALRLLVCARHVPGWFSAQDAVRWVGGRRAATVLRHLNDLVRRGLLESLGQTRAKRYRIATPHSALPGTPSRVLGAKGSLEPNAARARGRPAQNRDLVSADRER